MAARSCADGSLNIEPEYEWRNDHKFKLTNPNVSLHHASRPRSNSWSAQVVINVPYVTR